MSRKYLVAGLAVAVLAVSAVVWTFTHSHADQGNVQAVGKAAANLPIAQVILFNSGVGYFERQGDVIGDTKVELTFPTHDVNDLLKSLVLQDTAGGRVHAVSYDSQDPVEKILRSFALDLNNNPTFGQILNQARGEKIEVTRMEVAGGKTQKVAGTIIGMESHRQVIKDTTIDVEQLNMLTAEGILNVPLAQVVSVRFQNQTLENEFQRALQVLAGSHDVQKKTVALQFNGAGKRGVKVGYVVERPIWKTTYRLVLEPNGKLFMQGWAIVENTSDDDWNNVRMVLVSGKPISYRMDLYEPLYIPRPLVEPELFASLRPPVYGGSMGIETAVPTTTGFPFTGNGRPRIEGSPVLKTYDVPSGNAQAAATILQSLYHSSNTVRVQANGNNQISVYATPQEHININSLLSTTVSAGGGEYYGDPGKVGGGKGGAGGVFDKDGSVGNPKVSPNNLLQPYYQNPTSTGLPTIQNLNPQAINPQNKLTWEMLQARREMEKAQAQQAKQLGTTIAGLNYKEGIQSLASSEEVGDYYQYIIDQKISLARQKSAMLPILNQTIAGSKVSIYNEAVHAKYPLLGIRLKNTSGKPLTQGPITVYDDGSYAGDTRTLDLQPNEERLLSYAVDQGTEVKTELKTHLAPDMNFKIGGNSLTANYTVRQTKSYTIKNRSTNDRTIIIEHPIRNDWKLIEPKKPNDRSRDVFRFEVAVKAGATVKHEVIEDQSRVDPFGLVAGPDTKLLYAIAEGIEIKPEVKVAFRELLGLTITKGVMEATYKDQESKTYFIQNNSARDHNFTIDHIIRKDWKRLDSAGKDQVGPEMYQFKLEVKSKNTAKQEVLEEHVFADKTMVVANLDDAVLRQFIAHKAPAANVKNALQQVLDKQTALKQLKFELGENKLALKLVSDDQARVRENLRIIPQSSEHYKDFLKKFVAQETQIEEAQRTIRAQEALLQKTQKEYDAFVSALTVQ